MVPEEEAIRELIRVKSLVKGPQSLMKPLRKKTRFVKNKDYCTVTPLVKVPIRAEWVLDNNRISNGNSRPLVDEDLPIGKKHW